MGGGPDRKTVGPVASVPCPWCKKANDFRDTHAVGMLNTGSGFECDHCKEIMVVVAIRSMPQVVMARKGEEGTEDDV